MNRHRALGMVGATLAGLIGVTSLTGAAAASAAPTSTSSAPGVVIGQAGPVPNGLPPAVPGTPSGSLAPAAPGGFAPPGGSVTAIRPVQPARPSYRSDRTLAKVKAVVLQAYPNATITSITARDGGGWTVSLVTLSGRKGSVIVTPHYGVSRLIVARARHRQGS